MLLLLNILVVVFLASHFAFTSFVIKGLNKTVRLPKVNEDNFVSILIAARNESANIERLLDSIAKNTYRKSRFEVIIVDDHSEDSTVYIINTWKSNNHDVNLKLVHGKGFGKKEVLKEGIKVCANEIILQTDADCEVPQRWIEIMSAQFVKPEVKMVAGPVQLVSVKSLFDKLQSLEFSSLIASSIGLSNNGWNIMANAANLAYLKASREELVFNEKSKSGDDVFFIQQLARTSPDSIVYISDNASLVNTQPSKGIAGFLNQRARWASKTSEYPNPKGKLVAIHILLLNMLAVVVVVSFIVNPEKWIFSFIYLVTRFLLDYSILRLYYTHTLKQQLNPIHAVTLSIVYPLYALGVVAKILFGKVTWKGRKL